MAISASDFTDVLCRVFKRHEWGAAYEGFVEGAQRWNERGYTGDPTPFLITIGRRVLNEERRCGLIQHAWISCAVCMSRLNTAQRVLRKRRYLVFANHQSVRGDRVSFFPVPLVTDSFVVATTDAMMENPDMNFMAGRDAIDREIVRFRAAGVQLNIIAKHVGISVAAIGYRLRDMQRAYALHAHMRSSEVPGALAAYRRKRSTTPSTS